MVEKHELVGTEQIANMCKRLDALIALNLLQISDRVSNREQIKILSQVGLKYAEIANIIGRSRSYVASELTLIKKRKKGDSGT